ncbi:MAG: tRNA epoxyqueuosine(34) reductase QueG [Rikenellaceae bacterium]|nr:tRNA epoxyqueuosine(34) reductase QueG [Rikenellaceae bacterium]
MIEYSDIKRVASAAGFDLCGVTAARPLVAGEASFGEWLNAGYASSLEYMYRNREKRFDAGRLVEGARSVVVCAVRYKLLNDKSYHAESRTKIASYACRRDYHKSIKKMLQQMLKSLQTEYPQLQGRAFVDSEPLSEKQYAVEAGLGWIGRQSLLVTPQYGTALLLGVLLLDDEVSRYDRRYEGVGCGECRRCVEACPTKAVVECRGVDTSHCISCHTIEAESQNELDLGGWIFGCDECQLCCPYNKNQADAEGEVYRPMFLPAEISAEEWLAMSEEEFTLRFGSTPLKRSGLRRIQQNVEKNKGV